MEPEEETQFHITIFFNSIRGELGNLLDEVVEEKKAIKWHFLPKVVLEKTPVEGEEEIFATYFHSKMYAEYTIDLIEDHLDEARSKIIHSFEKILQRGSGWTIKEIAYFEL